MKDRKNKASLDNFDPDNERKRGHCRKRKQVKQACTNCRKAHSACGKQRPCPRCVARKEEHKCIDLPRKRKRVNANEEIPIAPSSPLSVDDMDSNPPSDIPSSPPTDSESRLCTIVRKPITRKRHRSRIKHNVLVSDINSSSSDADDDTNFCLGMAPVKLEARVSISLPKVKNTNKTQRVGAASYQTRPLSSSSDGDFYDNTNISINHNNNNNFNNNVNGIVNSTVEPSQEHYPEDNFFFQEELQRNNFQPPLGAGCPTTFQQQPPPLPADNYYSDPTTFPLSAPPLATSYGKMDDLGFGGINDLSYESEMGYAFDQFFLPDTLQSVYASPYGRETSYWF